MVIDWWSSTTLKIIIIKKLGYLIFLVAYKTNSKPMRAVTHYIALPCSLAAISHMTSHASPRNTFELMTRRGARMCVHRVCN